MTFGLSIEAFDVVSKVKFELFSSMFVEETAAGSIWAHRFFDIAAHMHEQGLTFFNLRRKFEEPVPSLTAGNSIHIFGYPCCQVIDLLEEQGLLIGFDFTDPVAKLGDDLFLVLRANRGMLNVPEREAGGTWFFEEAILMSIPPSPLEANSPGDARYPRPPSDREEWIRQSY
jgi:hypothetical protein